MEDHQKDIINNIENLKSTINDLNLFSFKKSQLIENILDDPYTYGKKEFIKILERKKLEKNTSFDYDNLIKKFKNYESPSKSSNFTNEIVKYEEQGKKILSDIKSANITFNNLSKKEIRYLLSYVDFPDEDFNIYMDLFIFINNKINILTSIFIRILTIYYYHYDKFVSQSKTMMIMSSLWDKFYNQERKFWNRSLLEIKSRKDFILSADLIDNIVHICFQERLNKRKFNILEIIPQRLPNIIIESCLYKNIVEQIAKECFGNISNTDYQEILERDLLQSTILPRISIDSIVSQLIIVFKRRKVAPDIKKVKRIILSNPNYGDPRLNKLQWANIDKRAKQIFMTWLAKDDLVLFFEQVFKDQSDTHGRKDFWVNYINSSELISSRVILSNDAYENWKKNLIDEDIATHHVLKFDSLFNKASCFILEFNNATIAEFSVEGNALFIYKPGELNIDLEYRSLNQDSLKQSNAYLFTKKDFYNKNFYGEYDEPKKTFPKFNSRNKVYKIHHNHTWQDLTSKFLSSIGVYPGEN